MPALISRAESSPSSPSVSSSSSPSPSAITTSSPTFSFSDGAPTGDLILIACIAVGLLIATIGASYLIFKSLGVSEWFQSRRLLQQQRSRKGSENEARRGHAADIEAAEAPTPTTVSFPSPVASPNTPEMKFNHDLIAHKTSEYSRNTSSTIGACLQPGVPAAPVPSLPAIPPPAAQAPGSDDRAYSGARTLDDESFSETKLTLTERFKLLRARREFPQANDPNDRYTTRNAGELGRSNRARRVRTSASSPSSPIVPTSPRLDSLPHRSRGYGSPTPSVLQQAADTVVGAHPCPGDIRVITPTPAVVQLLNSPEVGRHFQLDFPWVSQDIHFGMVGPDASSVAARKSPCVNYTGSGSSDCGSEEESVYTNNTADSADSPPTEHPTPSTTITTTATTTTRTPPASQLPRGMFGDTTANLYNTHGGAGVTLSPAPPPFLMLNNGNSKYPSQTSLSKTALGSSPRLGQGGGSLDQLEESLSLSLSLKSMRKKPSRSRSGKENVDPNGSSPKLLAVAAAAAAASQARKFGDSEAMVVNGGSTTRVERPVFGSRF
ncbi:hypothetical protein EST38_g6435 [Candolleomyces aberdarensis]|uniref:Uncharacterized protein n=1 Tax=Candolleomyces aberdarensis TaxID=2316362 RepID=A0A4Q2DHM1_9AGAR|nr:hypothetical protein EST38_g6435 [Candolleomyces aberdarensis]